MDGFVLSFFINSESRTLDRNLSDEQGEAVLEQILLVYTPG